MGENYTNYRSRITFKFKDSGLYDLIKKLQLYISTFGSKYIGQDAAFVNVYTRTQEDVTAGNDVWTKIIDQQKIAGWPGWNTLNVNVLTTNGTTYVGELRFEFGQTDYMPQYTGLKILSIRAIGIDGYNSPSNLARTGHIYDYDSLQNAVFPAGVRATKFWTNTGTSNDIFIMSVIKWLTGLGSAATGVAGALIPGASAVLNPISQALGGVSNMASTDDANAANQQLNAQQLS